MQSVSPVSKRLNEVTSGMRTILEEEEEEEDEEEELRSPEEAGVNRVYVRKTSLATP